MRLGALDVFRGMTIALMILVNMAGAAPRCYPCLDHSPWAGWTLTDLVFPFFLFAVGMAAALSLRPERPRAQVYARVLKRASLLFVIGALGNCLVPNGSGSVRLMGVLQRISLCYLAVSLCALYLGVRAQAGLCAAILVGYWAALTQVHVPGLGASALTRAGNLASYVDRSLIGSAHLYYDDGWNGLGDPEGLLSTLPAIVSAMFGYFAGLFVKQGRPSSRLSLGLLAAGLACALLGDAWGLSFPVIKKLWTSSFTLLMGGFALIVFAGCYELAEVRGARGWLEPFAHFGRNSLAAFMGSILVLRFLAWLDVGPGGKAPSLFRWILSRLFEPWLGPYKGSAAFALLTVLIWWRVLRWLDQRGWHLKV